MFSLVCAAFFAHDLKRRLNFFGCADGKDAELLMVVMERSLLLFVEFLLEDTSNYFKMQMAGICCCCKFKHRSVRQVLLGA
jgi:hypothetical protein